MELVMIWTKWLRKLFVTLASRRSGFDHNLVHVKFVVEKVALEQIFCTVTWVYFLLSIVPPMHHSHSVTNHRPFTNPALANVIQ